MRTPVRISTMRAYELATSAVCEAGTIAILDGTSGKVAQLTSDTASGTAVGVFKQDYNQAGGDINCEVEIGVFRFENDDVVVTDIGKIAYWTSDGITADSTTSGAFAVGLIDGVDEEGAWVLINPTVNVGPLTPAPADDNAQSPAVGG